MDLLIKNFEKKMSVFGFKQHQEFLTYYKLLCKSGMSIQDVMDYIEERKRIFEEESNVLKNKLKRWEQIAPKCLVCQTTMQLYPVNTSKIDQTGDDSKSQWFCPKCWHEEYNMESVGEILEKSIKGFKCQ